MSRRAPSLVAIVARRILVFAALASAIQVGVVFVDYWFNDEELGRILIEQQTAAIHDDVRAVLARGGQLPGEILEERYDLDDPDGGAGYYVRVRYAGGAVLYSNCGDVCETRFLPDTVDAPNFWMRTLRPGRPLTLAGGRLFADGDGPPLVVEFASIGDPQSLVVSVLLHEMIDHMVVPMGLMLFLVIGATLVSTRHALRSVAVAAAAADRIDPNAPTSRLPVEGMPLEIARLAEAVNRAFERIATLVRSQKIFAASVAHEIRTPLAVMRLELERIDDPRVREAEQNLDLLAHTMEQLTALARLDAIDVAAFVESDLADLARRAIEEIAPLVYARGKHLEFTAEIEPRVRVLPGLVETLVRNLVENAVKHTRSGTTIRVATEAPAVLVVRDDGGGFAPGAEAIRVELGQVRTSGALGLGLKIVERIASLHGADLAIRSERGEGVEIRVAFPPNVGNDAAHA